MSITSLHAAVQSHKMKTTERCTAWSLITSIYIQNCWIISFFHLCDEKTSSELIKTYLKNWFLKLRIQKLEITIMTRKWIACLDSHPFMAYFYRVGDNSLILLSNLLLLCYHCQWWKNTGSATDCWIFFFSHTDQSRVMAIDPHGRLFFLFSWILKVVLEFSTY